MKTLNLTFIISSLIIGISVIISIWLYRDLELRKLVFQMNNQQKIDNCIKNVQARYSKTAEKGAGILNEKQIYDMKNEMNGEEERCITRYK